MIADSTGVSRSSDSGLTHDLCHWIRTAQVYQDPESMAKNLRDTLNVLLEGLCMHETVASALTRVAQEGSTGARCVHKSCKHTRHDSCVNDPCRFAHEGKRSDESTHCLKVYTSRFAFFFCDCHCERCNDLSWIARITARLDWSLWMKFSSICKLMTKLCLAFRLVWNICKLAYISNKPKS